MKNTAAKTVKRENAYEVWQTPDGSWTWYVLKKWQADAWRIDNAEGMAAIDSQLGTDRPSACRHPVINVGVKDSDSSATLGKCMVCGELVTL